MRYSQATLGRVFVLRLEDGEALNAAIEAFAKEHGLERGVVFYVGGGAGGTSMVVGPDATQEDTVAPLFHTLVEAHETLALGTLFPNEAGEPVLHMHAACGREGHAAVGCTRAGLETWLIGEVVLLELVGAQGMRQKDPATGFELLELPQGYERYR